jgi:hypothetical protein
MGKPALIFDAAARPDVQIDSSWYGRLEPFTGEVLRDSAGAVRARRLQSGWWAVRMPGWPLRLVKFADEAIRFINRGRRHG